MKPILFFADKTSLTIMSSAYPSNMVVFQVTVNTVEPEEINLMVTKVHKLYQGKSVVSHSTSEV